MDIKKYIIQREKVTSFSMRRKFTFHRCSNFVYTLLHTLFSRDK